MKLNWQLGSKGIIYALIPRHSLRVTVSPTPAGYGYTVFDEAAGRFLRKLVDGFHTRAQAQRAARAAIARKDA